MSVILAVLGCAADAVEVVAPDPADTAAELDELAFGFPVLDRWVISGRIGVDHDPVDGTGLIGDATCLDYLGRSFPYCYDEHDGSDFLLDGGFSAMDAGSVPVIAAEDGVVVAAEDGHYDRCHTEDGEVSCDGYDGIANHVVLEHAGGLRTLYWHLKRDSVAVAVGDEVTCGQELGLIGSSGYSSLPHLHFELQSATGVPVDPYAGPFSQEQTFWEDQGPAEGLPGPGCTGADAGL